MCKKLFINTQILKVQFLRIKLSKRETFFHASNLIVSKPVESRVIAFESRVSSPESSHFVQTFPKLLHCV